MDDFDVDGLLGEPFIPGKVPISPKQRAEIARAIETGDEETLRRLSVHLAANVEEFLPLIRRLAESAGSN